MAMQEPPQASILSHGSFITTRDPLRGKSTLREQSARTLQDGILIPPPLPASSLPPSPCLAVSFPTVRYQHGIPPTDFCFIWQRSFLYPTSR